MANEYDQNTHSLDSAEKAHISEVEPKKESSGGILGMFGFGKKKEEVPSENAFSSEAPQEVGATKVEHESEGRDLIGSKEDGVKPGSAFSSEPAEEVQPSRGLFGSKEPEVKPVSAFSSEESKPADKVQPYEVEHESTGRGLFGSKEPEVKPVSAFSSEESNPAEKVHFSEEVEPKHESLAETGSVESTDRGLFGFGGKKAEEVRSENTYSSEAGEQDVEPKHESLLEQMHRSDQERSDDRSAEAADRDEFTTESTDRGLFGFGGKKKDEVTSENAFNSEYEQKIPVSEHSEPKHESVLEELHLDGPERSEQAANHEALNSEFEEQVRVSKDEPESTDRGLFGLGKKNDEVTSEDAFNSEFEQKAQVSEYKPKKDSLAQKPHRSGSSSSSSSDEEEVEEGGVKKKKLTDKIKDKVKGTDKKPEEVVYHQEDNNASSIPVDHEKYSEGPLPVHQGQPEEKKGFMEKIKDKLPGHKKNDETTPTPAVVAPPHAAVDHGPVSPPEEKKGFLSKIKDKLHHSKTDEEKEIEKERKEVEKERNQY